MRYILSLAVIAVALLPHLAEARIGVGVGTGKIGISETLLPGKMYNLPSLTVINTGDETSDYGVGISYHQQQSEMRPPAAWFMFSPETFTLEPGQSQSVSIRLSIPMRAAPGDYFAYIEGHPILSDSGETRVNIASAAKLNFEIGTSGAMAALAHRAVSFWTAYSPWTNRIALAFALLGLIFVFRKFFKVQVNFKK